MKDAFTGRAAPLFIQAPMQWIKTLLLSGIAAMAFSLWGCPAFLRLQTGPTGWAFFFAFCSNILHLTVLPRLSPSLFVEDRWTIPKELLINSWVVVSCLLAASLVGVLPHWSFQVTEEWFMTVIPLSCLITVFLTLSHNVFLYRNNDRRAQRIRSGIRKRIRLNGDMDREFSLPVFVQGELKQAPANEILYLHSADGTTMIAFHNPDGIEEGRASLEFKSIREQFRKLSNFYRCHRDWMVNMDKVTGIRADALGFFLEMEQEGMLIPVSSSLNNDMEGRLMK